MNLVIDSTPHRIAPPETTVRANSRHKSVMSSKTLQVLEFVVSKLKGTRAKPFIVGISGCQGSGKSTLASDLAQKLRTAPYSYSVVEFSVDDVYLTHKDQLQLSQAHPENKMLANRGPPGTHVVELAVDTLDSLQQQKPTAIPQYDKSAYNGKGDQKDKALWPKVSPPYDVIIFEGWFVGFQPLTDAQVIGVWNEARNSIKNHPTSQLARHSVADLLFINEKLKLYTKIWDKFNAFIHLDAEEPNFVYNWRLQQEHELIKAKGSGMTDSQVREFIDGYMPSYELYVSGLRSKSLSPPGTHLRLVLGEDRQIKESKVLQG